MRSRTVALATILETWRKIWRHWRRNMESQRCWNLLDISIRRGVTLEDEAQKDKPPPSEYDSGIEVTPYKIGRKEWEELYIAVLYTIKHKLGANSGGYSVYAEDLYEYAQEAFCMSDEDHKRFLSIAQDEKICSYRDIDDLPCNVVCGVLACESNSFLRSKWEERIPTLTNGSGLP
ncbi:hypothetical protein AVEN_213494-1 [Araneus ventricosus]|uniref:Uncharacterized protein n=1 Tax=Araneus ventricosus TaxID=182803 RepID=A0A4Y2PUJ9_ARAVE|nr:hypothetical protein AVEN_213494-1 [Araneus ventricosus]